MTLRLLLFVFCALLLLSGCSNDSSVNESTHKNTPTSSETSLADDSDESSEKPLVSATPSQISDSSNQSELSSSAKKLPAAIDDGFYGEDQAPEPLIDVDSTIPNDPADNASVTKQTVNNNKQLVENTDFSSATNILNEPEKIRPLFCLNNNKNLTSKISVTQACKKLSNRLASVDYQRCVDSELELTSCQSVNGFPILVREFKPLPLRKPLGRVLVIGGTHGDELTSVSVTLRWIEQLSKNHSGLFHWRMAPVMNPDALLKRSATRTNFNGVDLNRNMPSDDWDENALKYWREKSGEDKRKFPGDKPASEPETKWLMDEISYFKPDVIISVHAPYGVVDFDSLLLNTAPKSLGKLHLNLLGTYPGSLGNYAGINKNIPVITLELPHSWEMPSVKESDQIWLDIVQWLKKNMPATRQ